MDTGSGSYQANKSQPAYEIWNWERCYPQILSLKHRLGYRDRLWILGFEVLENGTIVDPIHNVTMFKPQGSSEIPSRHTAVPELYCLLSQYASADDIPFSGELISFAALDPLRRPELSSGDCSALLSYSTHTERDFTEIGVDSAPFFGERGKGGDFSFTVWPLPRIPVPFTLWRGDDDVPDNGTLLFDRSAIYYLGQLRRELAWLTVWRLHHIIDPEYKWGGS